MSGNRSLVAKKGVIFVSRAIRERGSVLCEGEPIRMDYLLVNLSIIKDRSGLLEVIHCREIERKV